MKQFGFDNLDFLVHLNYKGEYSFHDINDVKNNPNDTFYFPYYCSLILIFLICMIKKKIKIY